MRSILTMTIWVILRVFDLFNEWTSSFNDGVSRLVVRLVDPLLFSDDNVKIHHIREEVILSKVSSAIRFVWVSVLEVWSIDAASGYEIPTVVYPQIVSGSGGIILATATVMRARASTRDNNRKERTRTRSIPGQPNSAQRIRCGSAGDRSVRGDDTVRRLHAD